jgi:hypothetical protein
MKHLYLLLTVIIIWTFLIVVLIQLCRKSIRSYSLEDKKTPTNIAVAKGAFYVIYPQKIAIYSQNTGKRKLQKPVGSKMSCAKLVNGDLVVADAAELKWLHPKTLQLIDRLKLPIQGTIVWLDWAWNKWWLCEKVADNFLISCFNLDWEQEGYWKLPKQMSSIKITSGAWVQGKLYLADESSNGYILGLPADKDHAKLVKVVNLGLKGTGIAIDDQSIWKIQGQYVVRKTN